MPREDARGLIKSKSLGASNYPLANRVAQSSGCCAGAEKLSRKVEGLVMVFATRFKVPAAKRMVKNCSSSVTGQMHYFFSEKDLRNENLHRVGTLANMVSTSKRTRQDAISRSVNGDAQGPDNMPQKTKRGRTTHETSRDACVFVKSSSFRLQFTCTQT
jgi:hypothetical protein